MNEFLKSYFARINYTGTPKVDLATLRELNRLHSQTIPFENLTPLSGELVSLEPDELAHKIIDQKRGGYCYEQNVFFGRVLRAIGFNVTELGARVVYGRPDDSVITQQSHLFLKIEVNGESYLTDVGFGILTIPEPIKFQIDIEQPTSHEIFRIKTLEDDMKIQAFVAGEWKTSYRFNLNKQYPVDYFITNYFLCTHSSSHFTYALNMGMPFKEGRRSINNNLFSTYYLDGRIEKRELKSVDEMKKVMTEHFNIKVPESSKLNEKLQGLIGSGV